MTEREKRREREGRKEKEHMKLGGGGETEEELNGREGEKEGIVNLSFLYHMMLYTSMRLSVKKNSHEHFQNQSQFI